VSSAPVTEQLDTAEVAARVATLYGKHGRMVYGICRAMLRDAHEAEDATQQTFLSAHRALLGGARVRDEGGWLATIARNECRARITAGMRRPVALGDEDLALIADPSDEAARRSHAAAIRDALEELPERQREAVVLRDLYGLRYGEVARALGLSRAATETLLFRARRSMRQRLRPVVTTALVVPLSVQEGLAQALPGFRAASPAAALAAGTAGGGLLAKLTAGPAAVKLATAAVAVTTVGAVGTADSERATRDRAEQRAERSGAIVVDRSGDGVADGSGSQDDDSQSGGSDDRSGDEHESSGPGGGGTDSDSGDDSRDSSGSGSDDDTSKDDSSGGGDSGDGGSADDRGDDDGDSSGRGGNDGGGSDSSSGDDDPSSGSDDSSGSGSDSDDSDSGFDSGSDDSSGSGSGSSGSGSSGSGSGSDDDSSGSGSGSDDSSGKGSSGGDDEKDEGDD
jgi:RNA polymerase sigma factor (sigma-70 family)